MPCKGKTALFTTLGEVKFLMAQSTIHLLQAEWLPRPLCYVGELFSLITPTEAHLLLTAVHTYLKVVVCVSSMVMMIIYGVIIFYRVTMLI